MGIQVYAYTNVVTILETKDLLCLVARDALLNLEDVAVKTLALATCICIVKGNTTSHSITDRTGACKAMHETMHIHGMHVRGGKAGGGGAVRIRPDTKSEGGGRGLLSGRGRGTLYERGDCNPQDLFPPMHIHDHARTSCNPSWRK